MHDPSADTSDTWPTKRVRRMRGADGEGMSAHEGMRLVTVKGYRPAPRLSHAAAQGAALGRPTGPHPPIG